MRRVVATFGLALPSALALLVACATSEDAGTPNALGDDARSTANDGAAADVGVGRLPVSAAELLHSKITVGPNVRTYELSIPAGYSASTPPPLVFVLHGSARSGDEIRVDWPIEAFSSNGALFVYPDAEGDAGDWDLDDPADANPDVAFFDALLVTTAATYPFDASRVFVAGFSRGAYFANQLGCRRGGTVRAIASFEGSGPFELAPNGQYDTNGQLICSGASQRVAALLVQADDDLEVTLDAGKRSLSHWSYADGCDATSTPVDPTPCVSMNGCTVPVVWCEPAMEGHLIWPPGTPEVWNFFAAQK